MSIQPFLWRSFWILQIGICVMMWIWPENAHKNSSKFYSTNLPHDLSWRHVHRCEIIVHLFTRPFLCVYSSCCHGNACIWISTVEELSSRFFPRQGNTKYLKYFRNIYTNTFWLEKNLPTKNVEKKHIFFILSENSIFFYWFNPLEIKRSMKHHNFINLL